MTAKPLKIHTLGKIGNPALVFFHAFPFSARMWKGQMECFSEKFYCVAPDLPGFGESPSVHGAFTFELYVDLVLNELKAAKIEKAIWCGLSMGGYLALRMYERDPEMCRALVLCDTQAVADGNAAKLKRWSALQTLQVSRTDFLALQWAALVGESSRREGFSQDLFYDLLSDAQNEGIAAGLLALATRTDSTSSLGLIQVPTLVVVGDEDKVTPLSEAQKMVTAIPGARLEVLAKVGHLSNLENPQKFNGLLSHFFQSLPL